VTLREDLLREFCPQNALELERDLALLHRSKGGQGFVDAIVRLQEFVGTGTVRHYPCGTTCQGYVVPRPWNLKGGFLRLSTGEWLAPDLRMAPIGGIFLSGASHGTERLRVVDVGAGTEDTEYTQSVEGCAVLATGKPPVVYREAVAKHGARCVITDFMPTQDARIGRTPEEMPDTVNYTSFGSESQGEGFGFNVSHRTFKHLQDIVGKEVIEVDTFFDADAGTGDLQVLETHIGTPGTQKPILLLAHLCHPRPGANDNASGAALLAELVRVLHTVPLEREVIALWMPEFYGTIAWFVDQKPDLACAINIDMVGEDQAKTGSTLEVTATPWSLPSFIADLMAVNLTTHDFRLTLTGFTWGSDHAILNDASVHVPALSLTQWPDRYYHSSDDTPDKSSVQSFEWVGRGVLDTLADLIAGIPDERAAVVAARIREQGLTDSVRYSDPLIRDWVARRTRAALLALQETTDTPVVRAELAAAGATAPMPAFQPRVPVIGPIEEVWMTPDDLQWNDRLIRDFPCWYHLKAEVVNFIQLGVEREDALKLATAEFDAPAAAVHAARHYLDLLIAKGYLLP
jgi:aminopeptidase-like protein